MIYFNNLHVHLQFWKKPVSYGQLAEHLCEPCYSSFSSSLSDNFFRTNIEIFEWFFLQYVTELITFSLPLNQIKKNKFVILFSRSAITDQIFSGLKNILSILLGFRKHVRYVACMRARKLSLDSETSFVLSPGQIIYQRSVSSVYSLFAN